MAQDKELVQLRSRIAVVATGRGGNRQFHDELREAIVAWAQRQMADGRTRRGVAKELGVSDSSLMRWMSPTSRVREVVVHEVHERASARRLTLRLVGGAEVLGLELEDVIAIVRALG